MTNEITINKTHLLRQHGFSMLLLYANGCPYCEDAKKHYDNLNLNNVQLFKLELTEESLPFYLQQENINEITPETPMDIPKIYIYHPDMIGEHNMYGMYYKMNGYDAQELDKLVNKLESMSE